MKFAFMVIAHTDAPQLKRLIERIAPNTEYDSHVFLHIDKKADIEAFRFAFEMNYVTVLSERIDVTRCGISQVDVALALMEQALSYHVQFDRYILITGQDYPVMCNEKIRQIFSDDTKEFMRGHRVTGTIMNKKVCRYYFYNRHLTKTTLSNALRRILQLTASLIPKKDTLRIEGADWNIYYSSAYFAVSYNLLVELYEKGKNKKLYNYFKTAICSDEMYFITIAANSRFRDRLECVENTSHTLLDNSAITYFRYESRPIELTEDDFEDILHSNRIFARKFSSSKSEKLLSKLP